MEGMGRREEEPWPTPALCAAYLRPAAPGIQPRSELAILNHTVVSRPISCQTSKPIVLKAGSRDEKKILKQTILHLIRSLKV